MIQLEQPKIPFATLFNQEQPNGICRSLTAWASYDFRSHPKNYGRHSMELYFAVSRGPVRVEWAFNSNWDLKSLYDADYEKIDKIGYWHANGIGMICSHSPEPLYPGHEASHENCQYTGGDCFAESTYVESTELFFRFVSDPAVLWPELEQRLFELEQKVKNEREARRNFS